MIRVLVADDQRINRVLLGRCLDRDQYEVVEAENGREALELFEQQRPDVVFLDVMMPEMDGFETARAMKARLGNDHVPIIMVTSLSDEESLRQGMEAGADDFVPKPFNRVVLESKLNAALRTRQAFRSLRSKTAELQTLHEQSQREQVMAERLMAKVLRTHALERPMFRYRSRAMDVFNGDLLMASEGPNGRMRVMLGDFSGHGLAAAIGGLPVVFNFAEVCSREAGLIDVARVANAELRAVLPRDRFLAAVLLDIDPHARTVDVLNAGMPPVLVRKAGGGLKSPIRSTHLPLGVLDDVEPADGLVRLRLEPGDRLYLYSDGVNEAENLEGDVFGDGRLESVLATCSEDGAAFTSLLDELDRFVGDAPAGDDVTFMEVSVDAFLEELAAANTRNAAAARTSEPGRWVLRLNPDLLRSTDPLETVQAMLESFKPLEGRRTEVFAVVAELVNNAIDHGVLGLDSKMKQDLTGFSAFYELREQRLAALADGFVEISLNLTKEDERWSLKIQVEDSGPGFVAMGSPHPEAQDSAHGRGVNMVRGLCDDLTYLAPGNRVHASYVWTPE